MSLDRSIGLAGLASAAVTSLLLAACNGGSSGGGSAESPTAVGTGNAAAQSVSPYRPTATFQEIMDSVVDPAADYVWGAVGTIVDKTGVHELQPRTDKDWHELRRRAIVLAEAANLVSVPGRKVARGNRTIEENGELDPEPIQKRLDADHAALVGFADGLREVAIKLVAATDRKDVAAVGDLGGTLDEVCEACHKVFWYPDEGVAADRGQGPAR